MLEEATIWEERILIMSEVMEKIYSFPYLMPEFKGKLKVAENSFRIRNETHFWGQNLIKII